MSTTTTTTNQTPPNQRPLPKPTLSTLELPETCCCSSSSSSSSSPKNRHAADAEKAMSEWKPEERRQSYHREDLKHELTLRMTTGDGAGDNDSLMGFSEA
ncbi:hypothetical protein GGS20DRAFT_532317 [Poronia punctata]|nr:hypothetical protein GGS20DRAFT_532317 [Poronia punctata]